MLPFEALRGMRVMFATPCYGSQVYMHFACSLIALTRACEGAKLPCVMQMWAESLVPRARNTLAAQFLRTEGSSSLIGGFTHLFFLDADLAFRPTDVHRLLLHDRDIVAGVYPIKDLAQPQKWPVKLLTTEPDADGLLEAEVAPTGFMCIKRRVLEELRDKVPEYETDGIPHWDFFKSGVRDYRGYLSEDYWFCDDWRRAGGKVWVDPACEFQHIGPHVFAGKLGDSL